MKQLMYSQSFDKFGSHPRCSCKQHFGITRGRYTIKGFKSALSIMVIKVSYVFDVPPIYGN